MIDARVLIRRAYRMAAFRDPTAPVDVVDDTTDDTGDPNADADPNINAQTRRSLVVPGNIMPWIESAANEFGVPRDLLAAVVYQHSRFSGLNPNVVAQVAYALARSFNAQPYTTHTYTGEGEQNETQVWLDAAAEFAYGSTDSSAAKAYRTEIGRVYGEAKLLDRDLTAAERRAGFKVPLEKPTGITLGADKKLPAGKYQVATFPGGIGGGSVGGAARGGLYAPSPVPGLTAAEAYAVLGWAPSLFERYTGGEPSNAELVDIVRQGWNKQQLEAHLRAQPVLDENGKPIPGLTLGRRGDLYDLAAKYASDILGRDASPDEIHWLTVNNVPADPAHVSAFFQQINDHAVWHGDPTEWRAMEKRVQSIWDSLGLTGKVDAATVNRAIDGTMTDPQITDALRARPAPGYPAETKVGDVERARVIAEAAKKNLFPGEAVSDTELRQLIGMSPEQVLQHYRSIVPKTSTTGLPVGIESDYKALATSVLSKAGITGYDVTPEDLKFFALTKADPAAMLQHFATTPALAGAYPGLAFGLDSTQFGQTMKDLSEAYGGVFPGQTLAAPKGRDDSLAGYAVGSGVGASEFSGLLEQFRQERGRAPTAAEFKERRARPAQQKPPGGQPSAQLVDPGTPATQRGTPRPAIGGKRAAA